MDSEQYIKMLSIANSEIWKLHPNGFMLMWDIDSKHRSDISLNYYIENNIQRLEWPAYILAFPYQPPTLHETSEEKKSDLNLSKS